ncbi:carbohydrate ABC transporter permease [Bacillus sp. ISL-46]|jgi:multiple sugar transport system permease protein|uniref:carbohydrate ABC transporter permease n=1 Tax=Bacillus sp. ISL-46 TaxID=2819129 RepID=UPI002034E7C1
MKNYVVIISKWSGFYLGVGLFVLVTMFPFIWQLITSLKSPDDLYLMPPTWWPSFDFRSYVAVFTERPFLTYLKNSFIVSSLTTIYCIAIGAFCAYALARLQFRFKRLILSLVLAVSMFPTIAILSPIFILLKDLKLLNTYAGLILPYTTFGLPLTIWILTGFFREIPKELEESAAMDGCSKLGAFFRIILPLATPGIFTTAIIVFIHSWNEFLFSLSFMTTDEMRTVPVGIAMFPGQHELPWGDISAASVVVTVPLIILVLIFQRRIISGLTAGAVKG